MVFKKIIFQNRYVALETPPPFMANTILNFHFDYLNPSLRFSQEFLVILIDLEFCVVSFPYEKISFISHQEMSRNNFAHDLKGREVYHFAWFFCCKVKSLIKDGFPSKFISCPGISQPPIITSPASSRYQVLHIFLELRYYLQKNHLPCLSEKGNCKN